MGRSRLGPALAGVALALAIGADAQDADACGACYSSSSESTVVQDHRMAFSIGRQQTVLWDSITYSGSPKDFAYVPPAKPGSRLEPSNEAFFTALDASTRPIIMGPRPQGGGGYGGGGYGGDGYGGSGGSYDDEGPTIARLHDEYLPAHGLALRGRHHEIYLSDPRRVEPARLRTILRQPVTDRSG